jgi:NAD(P)-dependent dehydrogenase (short-subunit alcohol dehydrogenase family)
MATTSSLEGKVALVTGASRGIGRETALELARRGADVVVAARTVERRSKLPGTIGETVAAIEGLGRRAVAVATDMADPAAVDALAEAALEAWGRVDVLVNNAAYTSGHALTQPLWEMSRTDWELQFATNVHGPFSLTKAVTPAMQRHGGGVVVNITSKAYELVPVRGGSRREFGGAGPWAYGATKAAVNRMTNGIAAQLYEHGIAVIAMEPGFVKTEFVSLMEDRGAFDASEAIPTSVPAEVVAYLADPQHGMQYTGQVVSAPQLHAELGL